MLNPPRSLVEAQKQDSGRSHGTEKAAGMLKGRVKMSVPGGSEKNSKTLTRSIGRVWKESLKPYHGSQEDGIGRGHSRARIFLLCTLPHCFNLIQKIYVTFVIRTLKAKIAFFVVF